MTVERVYSCEAPGCRMKVSGDARVPEGWIETEQRDGVERDVHHFHCWDCVAAFAVRTVEETP